MNAAVGIVAIVLGVAALFYGLVLVARWLLTAGAGQ